MTPVLPRWADITVTKTGISTSQVKALPPASTALDPAELFQHVRAVREGFMGERQGKDRRSQAEGLKHCNLCCMSRGRGMSSPCSPQSHGQSRSAGQVAVSPTCCDRQAGSRLKRWRFLQEHQGPWPSFCLPVLFSAKQNFSGFSLWWGN